MSAPIETISITTTISQKIPTTTIAAKSNMANAFLLLLNAVLITLKRTFFHAVQMIITARVAVGTRIITGWARIESTIMITAAKIPVIRVSPSELSSPTVIPSHTGQIIDLKPLNASELRTTES